MDKNRDKDLRDQGYRDSAEGKSDKFKGRIKDAAGGLTGDSSLQAEGKIDQMKGKVEDTMGKLERKLDRSSDSELDDEL
jgi:uncharacterized protein YjbJ (UPF0337 family)